MKMPSPAARRYIYRVVNAAVLVAVGYGVLSGEEAALWGLLVAAVLGLADANVEPTGRHAADG